MKIMLDTNTLISAAVFGGKLLEIVSNINTKNEIVLCSAIVDEFFIVVNEKFPKRRSVAEKFIRELNYTLFQTPPKIKDGAFPSIRDKKDYPILASAIIADVDILITGDLDFENIPIKKPEILKPREYAEKYMNIIK